MACTSVSPSRVWSNFLGPANFLGTVGFGTEPRRNGGRPEKIEDRPEKIEDRPKKIGPGPKKIGGSENLEFGSPGRGRGEGNKTDKHHTPC